MEELREWVKQFLAAAKIEKKAAAAAKANAAKQIRLGDGPSSLSHHETYLVCQTRAETLEDVADTLAENLLRKQGAE